MAENQRGFAPSRAWQHFRYPEAVFPSLRSGSASIEFLRHPIQLGPNSIRSTRQVSVTWKNWVRGVRESATPFLNDNLLLHWFHKARTHTFIYFALVEDGFHFPKVERLWFECLPDLRTCLNLILEVQNPPYFPGSPNNPVLFFFDLSDPSVPPKVESLVQQAPTEHFETVIKLHFPRSINSSLAPLKQLRNWLANQWHLSDYLINSWSSNC